MEKIRVMLADGNAAVLESLSGLLRSKENIDVVSCVEDGHQALNVLRDRTVDVLVMDMLLPKLDGFGVLEAMERMGLQKKPRVLALTALMRDDFVSRAIRMGADYYMLKPYDSQAVYAQIMAMASGAAEITPSIQLRGHAVAEHTVSIDERIADIFLSMGIPAHIKGYHFLREAIKLVVGDRDKINAITKDLYPSVAINFGTTSSKVERAIRHAIDVAWSRGQMENVNMLFGSRVYVLRDKPTNGEFIALIADRLIIEKGA